MGSFNTYILEFPPDSTPEDRALLVTALFQIEFAMFETTACFGTNAKNKFQAPSGDARLLKTRRYIHTRGAAID
ncbi:hypothetical protein SDRG_12554 [Saprolegnia diclina VS20]|uniref:Uncharacterized protein n=1 Tax=Saprolegnia diclina (strain VS20) TaxID=1156394 RepID=T0RC36_SAPDV|nr:hypothetical protein SDRG_12554 [Saprolegnia diclina VS20]EQC29783.1 hypothetical protein SDRG_12554 [Saprolegnia diclina VS20]|eukprot:XP_008616849.1 hypothetical protein SDRG_12554 [Saprolegnia diclina VS20]